MRRGIEGDSGSTKSWEEGSKNAQRLAIKLQKVMDSRHASLSLLRQVDQYINGRLLSETSFILKYLHSLIIKAEGKELKEYVGQIYLNIDNLQSTFKSIEHKGYCNLTNKGGYVKPQRLNSLIDMDSELISTLSKLKNTLKDTRIVAVTDFNDIQQLVDDIFEILSARSQLLS